MKGSSSESELVHEAELQDAELQEAELHEAELQDGEVQEAEDQDADDQEADDQEAELQDAELHEALDHEAVFQACSMRTAADHAALSKLPAVTKRNSEAFGFGGAWMLAAARASSSPTPSARPALVLAADTISAPLT